ncbi:5'-methylthioadenosine/S-adenosylhomocysteine nucleosidase family protein [Taibaiella koreensis]|uniref:5'-methylthioadenosine/S-adenosylhomocysteine nucleosidase family protein n=1 Tax=Taibaiella koreensis TaxID=1268548 RepID=UPI000E59B490|nr:hypothetical protein [Taibaiella koreensis]
MQLHAELKFLKAELIRLNFEEYLSSKEFRLLTLEIDFDNLFNKALSQFGSFSPERHIDAFLMILNNLLQRWINAIPESGESKTLYKHFVFLLETIIAGYFSSKRQSVDLTPIIKCLDRITMIEKRDVTRIKKKLTDVENDKRTEQERLITGTKAMMKEKKGSSEMEQIDYAIITALEEEEMEKILPFINKITEIEGARNLIEIGTLGDDPKKKVVYASQHNTGMVDASILASELILTFKPRYLIMVGVLGGKPEDTNVGDVIVATKVFEIDRGKISDTGFKKETSVANITNKEIKKISRAKKQIESHLNSIDQTRVSEVRLHFGPIACVNQVIDLQDFFSEKVTSIDRKAVALEMESFAVVRACELLNEGKTTPIIIKSVMDNTTNKNDNAKPYAAWTSAKTLEFLLKSNII